MADDGFAAFDASSYRRLLGQLFAVTGDLAEAENLLQEAYARAFVRWSRVGGYDLPEAWVRRVALNLAAMADRSLRRRARPCCAWGPPHGSCMGSPIHGTGALGGRGGASSPHMDQGPPCERPPPRGSRR
jgi:DNA-directed RNA polymerase specialized sigma24 family protein